MDSQSMQSAWSLKPTLICLHSSGSTGGQWAALRAQLDARFRVLTPDFHGHGAEPAWRTCDDIVAADAGRIGRLVESSTGEVHLVGHSYGGAIALRVALQYPQRVTSVTAYEPVVFRLLFDRYGRERPASEIIELALDLRRRMRSGDPTGAARGFVDYWGGTGAWQRLTPGQQAGIAGRTHVIAAHFAALANDRPRLAAYRSLNASVLLLAGSDMRPPIRRIRELLRFAIPKATVDTLPAMGHLGPVSHAGAVARRIARFVERQVSVGDPAERELAA